MGTVKKKVDILDNPFLAVDNKSEGEVEIEELKQVRITCKVYFLNNQLIVWAYDVENGEVDRFLSLKNWFRDETSKSFLMNHARGYTLLNREAISYITVEEEE